MSVALPLPPHLPSRCGSRHTYSHLSTQHHVLVLGVKSSFVFILGLQALDKFISTSEYIRAQPKNAHLWRGVRQSVWAEVRPGGLRWGDTEVTWSDSGQRLPLVKSSGQQIPSVRWFSKQLELQGEPAGLAGPGLWQHFRQPEDKTGSYNPESKHCNDAVKNVSKLNQYKVLVLGLEFNYKMESLDLELWYCSVILLGLEYKKHVLEPKPASLGSLEERCVALLEGFPLLIIFPSVQKKKERRQKGGKAWGEGEGKEGGGWGRGRWEGEDGGEGGRVEQ